MTASKAGERPACSLYETDCPAENDCNERGCMEERKHDIALNLQLRAELAVANARAAEAERDKAVMQDALGTTEVKYAELQTTNAMLAENWTNTEKLLVKAREIGMTLQRNLGAAELDAGRLVWAMSHMNMPEHHIAFSSHVLSRGGTGDHSDCVTYIDAALRRSAP